MERPKGRAILIVLDSVGCGAAEDAADYGDEGADTLGHIAQACAERRGDLRGLREGPLQLPNLDRLGLGRAMQASTGRATPGRGAGEPRGQWGYGVETSWGKDTPSGHWEIAGTPVEFRWGYFPQTIPAFPPDLTQALIAEGDLPGILGDKHGSGTAIIEEYGEEHLRTLKPICYTSADSVLQIAAHEEAFGLERLYALCKIARRLCDPLDIGPSSRGLSSALPPASSRAPRIARISPFRRQPAMCWSVRRAPDAMSPASARSATYLRIGTPAAR
jgi:phosphopentomutase